MAPFRKKKTNKPAPVTTEPPPQSVASKVQHFEGAPLRQEGNAVAGAYKGANDAVNATGHAFGQEAKGSIGGAVKDVGKGTAYGGKVIATSAEDIGKGVAKPFEMLGHAIFGTPASTKPATKPATTRTNTVPASIVPHTSPTAGASSLLSRVQPSAFDGFAPTKAPAGSGGNAGPSGTGGAGGTGGSGLPAASLTGVANVNSVLNAGSAPNAEQASIQTIEQFAVNPTVAKEAMDWYTAESASSDSVPVMQAKMYGTSWFKTMFPGITQQIAKGAANVVSPGQYMSDYESIQQNLNAFAPGLADVLTPGLYGNLVGQNLSATQINGRIGLAFNQAGNDLANNAGAVSELSKWYGIAPTKQALAAFYITGNPADGAANVAGNLGNITTAAEGGASATSAGFTKLSQGDLLGMANAGVTASAIASDTSAASGALAATTTGTKNAPVATEEDLLASQGATGIPGETEPAAKQAVSRAVGSRIAQFQGGGGSAGAGQPGTSGAGWGTD